MSFRLNLLCGIFTLSQVWCVAQFHQPTLLNPGTQSSFFGYADLNNDGKKDVIGRGPNQFHIYPGTNESFDHLIIQSAQTIYSADFECEDINQDGYNDIHFSTGYYPNVNFQIGEFVLYPSVDATSVRSKLGDIDGDNIPDLICFGINSAFPGQILFFILRNTGEGEFELVNSWNSVNSAYSYFLVLDMDGDGLDDLVFQNSSEVHYRLNLGGGLFNESIVLTTNYNNPIMADWNNDGRMDYALMNSSSISFHFQNTNAEFEPLQQIDSAELAFGIGASASKPIVDYNGDGFLDFVFHSDNGQVSVLLNQGDNSFTPFENQDNLLYLNNYYWDDLNGDQLMDFIGLGKGVFLFLQSENGTLNYSQIVENQFNNNDQPLDANGFSFQPYNFTTIDLDGDGQNEIIGQLYNGIIQVENNYDGHPSVFNPISNIGFREILGLKDMNNDDITDVIVKGIFTTNIHWIERDASGNWQTMHALAAPINLGEISVQDINGDQENEFYSLSSGNTITLNQLIFNNEFQNISTSNIASFTNDSELYSSSSNGLTYGDFNGDGLKDIGITKGGSLRVLLQNPDNTFTTIAPPRQINPGDRLITFSNKTGDVNGDNIVDLVYLTFNTISNSNHIGICSFDNDAFEVTTIPLNQTFSNAEYYSLDDINADSFIDLIIPTDNTIHFWMGDGAGHFTDEYSIEISNYIGLISGIKTIHLNNDQMPDLLVETGQVGYITGTVTYYLINNFDSPFQVTYNCFADLNMDGLMGSDDYPLVNLPVALDGQYGVQFTNENGQIILNAQAGAVSASIQPNSNWNPTTSLYVTTTLTPEVPTQEVNFGLSPTNTNHSVSSSLVTTMNNCEENGAIWISIVNTGNTIASGVFGYEFDPLLTPVSFSETPLSINQNTIQWAFDGLLPGQTHTIETTMEVPLLDGIVSALSFNVFSSLVDLNNEPIFAEEHTFIEEINCRAISNDIKEENGWTEEGFIMAGTPLRYTIQFRNEDFLPLTQFAVQDALSEQFDLSSFKFIGSSHATQYQTTNDHTVHFHFPESTLSLEHPYGFVSFEITPNSSIQNGEIIYNDALIYLVNPMSYRTNTTKNTILTECPTPTVNIPDVVCPEVIFEMSAASNFFTNYEWFVDGNSIGQNANTEWSFGSSNTPITCLATTPICSSTVTNTPLLGPLAQVALSIIGNEILATAGFTSYEWYFEGELLNAPTTFNLTPEDEGVYSVLAVDASGCTSYAEIIFSQVINSTFSTLEIFPNPATETVQIKLPSAVSNTLVEIFNMNGQLVLAENGYSSFLEVSLSQLESGIYCIKVNNTKATLIIQ